MDERVAFELTAVENSFRFSDELGADDFMELLSKRVSELEHEVADYDESKFNKKQVKAFLVKSSTQLSQIIEVISK